MSLNTFWLRRTQSTLKTQSHTAVLVHWQITRYLVVYNDGDSFDEVSITGGQPACDIAAKHERANVRFEAWVQPASASEQLKLIMCEKCFKLRMGVLILGR